MRTYLVTQIVRAALEFRDVYSHERPTYASLSKSDFVDLFCEV